MSKTTKSETQARLRKEKAQREENKRKQQAAREAAQAECLEALKTAVAINDSGMCEIGAQLLKALDGLHISQRAAAEAVGKAVSWVNRVAKWARTGYAVAGPFSADGKARRKRDKANRVSPAKHPGIGHNHPPVEPPAGRDTIEFPKHQGGSQPVLVASAEKPIEQVQAEFAALADETPPAAGTETLGGSAVGAGTEPRRTPTAKPPRVPQAKPIDPMEAAWRDAAKIADGDDALADIEARRERLTALFKQHCRWAWAAGVGAASAMRALIEIFGIDKKTLIVRLQDEVDEAEEEQARAERKAKRKANKEKRETLKTSEEAAAKEDAERAGAPPGKWRGRC